MAAVAWIIIFLIVAAVGYKSWQGFFGDLIKKYVPEPLKPEEATEQTDQYIWPVIAGIIIATLILHPFSTIVTLIFIAIIAFVVVRLIRFLLGKIHS